MVNNYYLITAIVNDLANNGVSLAIKHIIVNNGKIQFYFEKRSADYHLSVSI